MVSSSAQCRTTMTGLTSSFVSLGLVMTVDAYTTTLALYRRNGDLFDNIFSLMFKGRQKKQKQKNKCSSGQHTPQRGGGVEVRTTQKHHILFLLLTSPRLDIQKYAHDDGNDENIMLKIYAINNYSLLLRMFTVIEKVMIRFHLILVKISENIMIKT